jgi:BolA protein
MSLTPESLTQIIKDRLQATEVEVQDMSGGCGQAFAVIIVSDIFIGKNKLARHRLVNATLKDEISQIHAFTQKVFTVAEWDEQKGLWGA